MRGASKGRILGQSFLGRGTGYREPETGQSLACGEDRLEARVARAWCRERKVQDGSGQVGRIQTFRASQGVEMPFGFM